MDVLPISRTYHVTEKISAKPSKRILLPYMPVEFFTGQSAQRIWVEQFIKTSFAHHYQANVTYFLPYLLATIAEGDITGAIGFQRAQDQALFLEQYLDAPIEDEIFQVCGELVKRQDIVEIGNLTSIHPGTSHLLFVLVIAILAEAGYEWAVFTATRQVKKILRRLGIDTLSLCEAKPELLPDGGSSWGSYYKNRPSVTVGNLPEARALLTSHPVTAFMMDKYQQDILTIAQQLGC